jgi:hypothetical protein
MKPLEGSELVDSGDDVVNIEALDMFDAHMETTIQAAVLGIDASENPQSIEKLESFLAKIASLSKQHNPFILIPDDNMKRMAVIYQLYSSMEEVGLSVSDEEFKSPHLLLERLGKDEFIKISSILTTIESNLLEQLT